MFNAKPDSFKVDFSQCEFDWLFHGVVGDKCGKCGATVNINTPSAGWWCVCGDYNIMSWHGHRMMYTNPTYGYGKEHIIKMLTPAWERCLKEMAVRKVHLAVV